MTPEDLQICRSIHSALISPDKSNINYLFLEPVDTAHFIDYLDYISKPMDLTTLGRNLDEGRYASKEEFYKDASLIFENAITFNKPRPNSGWVVQLSKKMTALLEREKKKAERKSVTMAMVASDADTASSSAAGEKKKLKLSLKRNSVSGESGNKAGSNSNIEAEEDKKKTLMGGKKIKLKLNRGKQLPEGVVNNTSNTSTSNNPSKSTTYTAPSNSNTSLEDFTKIAPMNTLRRAQCSKVLSSLKRRQAVNVKHFLKPMNDPKLVKDYKEKIEFPMDLGTISSK
jgi:hypothetical protein